MLVKLKQLLQGEWWKSMFGVLLRTFLAGVVPLILAYLNGQPIAWYAAISQIGLLLVAAILTSVAGIPVPGAAPWWQILAVRFLRQFAQFVMAGIGTALLFSDVDWKTLLFGALASSVSTVLIGSLVVIPAPVDVPPVDPPIVNVQISPASEPVNPETHMVAMDPVQPIESDIPDDTPQMGA